jgi:iron complex transport system permease protein
MMTRYKVAYSHLIGGLTAVLLVMVWLSLGIGTSGVCGACGLADWLQDKRTLDAIIVGDIRLPRTLLALLVGASLAMAGSMLQGLLKNPLADPSLLGVSQGAALGAAAVFYYGALSILGSWALVVAGLLGAGVTLVIMLVLARGGNAIRVILAGLAISTLSGAALAAALNFAPNPYAMQELVHWLMGSVSNKGLNHVVLIAPFILIGALILYRQQRHLYVLSLGESVATSLGTDSRRVTFAVLLGTALLVGASVAVAGAVGFVGLIVPHLLRPFVQYRPDRLLIPSALLGAILVLGADMLVRQLPLGRELKLGVLTSMLGGPLLLYLVIKSRAVWRGHP